MYKYYHFISFLLIILLAKLFGIGDFSPEQDEAKAIGS